MPYARNGECELYYDTFGTPSDPTLLLVNGLGSQCIAIFRRQYGDGRHAQERIHGG